MHAWCASNMLVEAHRSTQGVKHLFLVQLVELACEQEVRGERLLIKPGLDGEGDDDDHEGDDGCDCSILEVCVQVHVVSFGRGLIYCIVLIAQKKK
jgi:hypothetical protein